MSGPLEVQPHEHGITRVFVAEPDPSSGASRLTPETAADLLGASDVNAAKIEVVAPGSVDTLGLSGYLVDGYGVAADEVAPRREELDSLTGQIVLVPSSAFSGAQRLSPKEPLSFVGAFAETPAAAHEVMSPVSDVDERPAPTPPSAETPDEKTKSMPVGLIVIGALILAAILIMLF